MQYEGIDCVCIVSLCVAIGVPGWGDRGGRGLSGTEREVHPDIPGQEHCQGKCGNVYMHVGIQSFFVLVLAITSYTATAKFQLAHSHKI